MQGRRRPRALAEPRLLGPPVVWEQPQGIPCRQGPARTGEGLGWRRDLRLFGHHTHGQPPERPKGRHPSRLKARRSSSSSSGRLQTHSTEPSAALASEPSQDDGSRAFLSIAEITPPSASESVPSPSFPAMRGSSSLPGGVARSSYQRLHSSRRAAAASPRARGSPQPGAESSGNLAAGDLWGRSEEQRVPGQCGVLGDDAGGGAAASRGTSAAGSAAGPQGAVGGAEDAVPAVCHEPQAEDLPGGGDIDGMDTMGGADSDDDGDDDGNEEAPCLPVPPLQAYDSTGSTGARLLVADEGHSQPQEVRPKGYLMFHADYEGGNIESAKASPDLTEYEVTIRHDTMAPRYRLWFWFTVSNAVSGQRAIISLVNFSKTRSLYRHGMTPIVRSTSRPAWERLPQRSVFYYKSPRHKNGYVLSFVFIFDEAADEYEFAYAHPYTFTRLQRQLASWDRAALPHCRRELLCRTPQLRRVDVLTICEPPGACLKAEEEPNELSEQWVESTKLLLPEGLRRTASGKGARRPVVVVSARIHPGETPASFVCHGLVEFLLSDAPEAAALRRAATWVVVPMLNPDGCFMGNYRADFGGVDLNRMWTAPSRELEPSLFHTLRLLSKYSSHPMFDADLYIDIHAHSTSKHGFLFCNPIPEDRSTPATLERSVRLPKLLDAHMVGFSLGACRWDADPSKSGCARRVAASRCPDTLCYTLEASFFHCPDPNTTRKDDASTKSAAGALSSAAGHALRGASAAADRTGWPWPNTEEGFLLMGRQLAHALFDFYKLQKPGTGRSAHSGRLSARQQRR
uniref:Cytosolic carboxypeptidase 6 n=1 Tax=Tetraselmis sp. GSL018 TaxID=582737 RepID=A0A061SDH0_9CHLO